MKILQINSCHYRRGGADVVYLNTGLLLQNHGHSVAYFSSQDVHNDPCEFNAYFTFNGNIREKNTLQKVLSAPSYLYNCEASDKLEKLIKTIKPDVAHVHLFYGVLTVSILKILKRYNIPIVHTVHDYRLLCPVKTFLDRNGVICEDCKDKHYYYCLKKKCSEGNITQSGMVMLEAYLWKYCIDPLDYIDHFIFVSKFSQSKHCEYDLRFKEKSSQLYNFVPSPVNRAKSTKGSYFLYFGRLSDEKGIKTLLLAFSETTYNLKIAGMGPLVDVVKRYEQTNENINYAGFQTGEKLQKLILNASFVVIPSEWYENNPMSIIESFALQKPVMGANIGGIPELITNDINGYLFNTCNIGSLVRTLKEAKNISDQKYIDLANSAWEFAQQKFDSEIYYRNLLNIYKNVIENKR